MTLVLVCGLGVACAPSKPPAGSLIPSTTAPADTVSIDYPANTDLHRILEDVAAHFGLRLDGADHLNGLTSIRLGDVTWRQIFKVTLAPVGYGFYEKDGIVFIRPNTVIDALPHETRVAVIQHQPVRELAEFLGRLYGNKVELALSENRLTYRAHPRSLPLISAEIVRLDVPEVVIRRFARKPNFPAQLPALAPIPYEDLGYPIPPLKEDLTTKIYILEHIDARWIQPILSTKLQGSHGRVLEDVRINALIVTSKEIEVPLVAAIIKYLDDPRWYDSPAFDSHTDPQNGPVATP